MWRAVATSFTAFAIWDWLTTAGTGFIAEGSDWAVPLSALTTALWLYGTKLFITNPRTAPWLIVGGAIGTWAGLRWP